MLLASSLGMGPCEYLSKENFFSNCYVVQVIFAFFKSVLEDQLYGTSYSCKRLQRLPYSV